MLTAGLSADFGEVLTAANIPYLLLVAAARSCLQCLPSSNSTEVRIRARHSLVSAQLVPWPSDINAIYCEDDAQLHAFSADIAEGQRASLTPQLILDMQLTLAAMMRIDSLRDSRRFSRIAPSRTHLAVALAR